MSMMIRNSPDLVEQLFVPNAPLAQFETSPAFQERVRRQAPQALESVPGQMQPAMREQLMRQLGIGSDDLGAPAIGEAILKRMGERAASLRPTVLQAGEGEIALVPRRALSVGDNLSPIALTAIRAFSSGMPCNGGIQRPFSE